MAAGVSASFGETAPTFYTDTVRFSLALTTVNGSPVALDPVNQQGRPVSTPNGSVFLAPATQVEGEVRVLNQPVTPEQLARLQKQVAEEPAKPEAETPPEGG